MVHGPDEFNYQPYLQSAKAAALQARQVLLSYFGNLTQVSSKEQAGLVSEADVTSEKLIEECLKKAHPEVEFIGEEQSFKKHNLSLSSNELQWVVDPLDGTTNYVHRFPIFCISIGLIHKGEIKLGVIDVPMLDRSYTTLIGNGSHLNAQPLKVSGRTKLNDSLIATGFFPENVPALDDQIHIFSQLIHKARGVRRAGAAAFDLCMVAEGVFDGFWEKNLQPWDTCAGALLVKEAGGHVTDYSGKPFHITDKSIVATNGKIHNDIVQSTSQYC